MTRVVISSDHADIPLRQAIVAHVEAAGHTVTDIGPATDASTDYPKHGQAAAQMIAAQMLSMGARVIGKGLALEIVDAFLLTEFEGGRHATRVDMIEG